MEQSDFIRLFSESPDRFSWLFGAGMSQSASLPTAVDVMWDLKRRFYATEENQRVISNEVQNPAVREKISAYMQSRGFPPPGDPKEYSACFELIFKNDYERQRNYLQAMLDEKRISLTIGHRILAAMMASGLTKIIFSTNFDTVVEKAFAEVASKPIAAFHIEGSYAANAALNNDQFPAYVKLHGDFRYKSLKNLEGDLQTQDAELAKCLVNACNRFGLVVAGYSGRDESVMRELHNALAGNNPFPHGLYWTVMKGRRPLQAVADLIAAAKAKGLTAEIVEIETFDSLMSRIWNQIPDQPAALVAAVGNAISQTVNISLPPSGTLHPILRTNGLPVALPTKSLELVLMANSEWQDLRDAEARVKGRIICTREANVWAWGHEAQLQEAFGADLKAFAEVDMSDRVQALGSHFYLKRFLEDGIARALRRGKPLLQRSFRGSAVLIVDRKAASLTSLAALTETLKGPIHGQIGGLQTKPSEKHPNPEQLFWAEAVQIDLQQINGNAYLLLRPDVFIWPAWGRQDATDFLDKRRGGRFNLLANFLLDAWINILLPSSTRGADHEILPFDGPESAGNPKFIINDRTTFSRRPAA